MKIMELEPRAEFVSLRDAVDRLFEDSFIRPFNGSTAPSAFPVDLKETKEAYVLKAQLPGMKSEDIKIEATPDGVMIKGESNVETAVENAEYLRRELRYGKVQRSFTLPLAIDPEKIEAVFEQGLLTVTLPKTEVVKPKAIVVTAKG